MRQALLLGLVLAACAPTPAPPTLRSPGVEHPESAGFRVLERIEKDPLIPATDFTLIDQNQDEISLSDFRGKVVMMTFLYTNCPEACPLVAGNFVSVKKQITARTDADDLVQILVSTDPESDTPRRLSVYTSSIGGDWHFLTGELEEVAHVWDAYNIFREVQGRNEAVVVYHDYRTYLIDPDGMFRYEHIGVWYPKDIVPDVETLLDEF